MDLLAELMAEPVIRPAAVTAVSAPQPTISSTEVPNFTRGISDLALEHRSTPNIPSKTQALTQSLTTPKSQTHNSDSDSDAGGIQMIDNDSDDDYSGELQELSHEPISDDDLYSPSCPDQRENSKVPLAAEQKSLGSFPRRLSSSASGSGGRGGRVKASDLGLY
ncbi:uncharacterized protein K444DRAFT_535727 [Hyaloscypha bicolor E]|uniref:Uncharacterized protein n=1 Tax=Hyaloscypha bicolor E TaxID=1095630 RepID=A0A2J6T0F9_9HELO|nr:uncharacterized protein K444DRAFT_535727 [Hyaloscypha bicolor E]PMD56479.1 hypothetical protein K444DRAFT_535727 [Hyaloscypha bicolor E]